MTDFPPLDEADPLPNRSGRRRSPGRKVTGSDAVTPAMEIVIAALLAGKSTQEAAEAAQVTRKSVSTWLHHDASFIAALNQARTALWEESLDQLRALRRKSIDVLLRQLEADDADVTTALAVMKAIGGLDGLRPVGPTSVSNATVLLALDAMM